jgi:hypothetical protein
MKLWIARDKDGMLYLYEEKPNLAYSNAPYFDADSGCYDLPIGLFPEVTFENSPQEVELKLVE